MQVNQGLFKLDLVDHHAILGVPLDADAKQVRKRYLKIARKLHPDSLRHASDEQKQQASELLSKLVNPAYEVLSQEKSSVEHRVSLKLKGQQLQTQPTLLSLSTEQSKKVANSNNVDYEYANALKTLVPDQYESLEGASSAIGDISELNAVYVMRQGGLAGPADSGDRPTPAIESADTPADTSATTTVLSHRERRAKLIESFINRAKEFEYKGNFSRAIIELREAVKAHPQNPVCHAELGRMYMRSNQLTMAGIHTKRALEIDADNQTATDVKKKLDAHAKRMGKKNPPDDNPPSGRGASKAPRKPGGGGGGSLFGGLFGGKKRR